jgi:hypothetical protein
MSLKFKKITTFKDNTQEHDPYVGTTWGDRRYSSYSFSKSALDRGEWSASRPGRALPPVPIVQEAGWAPEPVWIESRGKILCPCRGSNSDHPARSQTLYCLSYPGSVLQLFYLKNWQLNDTLLKHVAS